MSWFKTEREKELWIIAQEQAGLIKAMENEIKSRGEIIEKLENIIKNNNETLEASLSNFNID